MQGWELGPNLDSPNLDRTIPGQDKTWTEQNLDMDKTWTRHILDRKKPRQDKT